MFARGEWRCSPGGRKLQQSSRLLVAAMLVIAGCSSAAAPASPTSPPAPPAKPTQAPVAPSPLAAASPSPSAAAAAFALIGYEGACPPPGAAAHHYTFQLFALDQVLPLQPGATINNLKAAMAGHVVGQTELVAPFSR